MKGKACIFWFLFFLAGIGHADIVCLKDGRILNGPATEKAEGGINVMFENGTVFIASELIMETLGEGASGFTPTTDFEKAQAQKGLVPFRGDWMKPSKRDRMLEKYFAERKAAIADEEAHRLWRNRRMEKTKHFEFEYTVPQHIFEKYRDLMEAYYTAFAKQWKIRQPKELGRLKVCFYADREKFHQIGGVSGGIVGYFRYLPLPMELNFYYDRVDPKFTEEVMFHETNHYLTKLINVDFSFPHFPGESLAEYYGASRYDPGTKKLASGLNQEGRLIDIQTDIASGKKMELKKLIETDRMYEHYNWGWSLVHFLMNHPKYKKKFQRFVIGLAKGKDVNRIRAGSLETVRGTEILRVFKKYMSIKSDDDLKRMETEWYGYLDECLQLTTTRGKELAAMAAAKTNPPRKIRASRLFREAIAEGSTNPLAFHHFAELLYRDGHPEEAAQNWSRAIELDPLNPQYYARLGRTQSRIGKKEEGARLMKLAIEIDPDYAWTIEAQLESLLEQIEEGK